MPTNCNGVSRRDCLQLGLGALMGGGLLTALRARGFAAEGVNLALVARSADALRKAAADIRKASAVDVEIMPADLSDAAAREQVAQRFPDVDILVNNAGAVPSGSIEAVDDATWRAAWELKMFGYINMTRIYFARMKARQRGVIINIIGVGGERLDFNYIAGSTGNAGLIAFTRALGAGEARTSACACSASIRVRWRPSASSGWGVSARPPNSAIPSAGPRSSSTCRGAGRRRATRSPRRSSSSPRISPPIPAAPC